MCGDPYLDKGGVGGVTTTNRRFVFEQLPRTNCEEDGENFTDVGQRWPLEP